MLIQAATQPALSCQQQQQQWTLLAGTPPVLKVLVGILCCISQGASCSYTLCQTLMVLTANQLDDIY